MKKKSLILFFIFFTQIGAYSQTPAEQVIQIITKGEQQLKNKFTDSALQTFLKAEAFIKKNNLFKELAATVLYYQLGDVYLLKKDAAKAHQYYLYSLQNARKFQHTYDAQLALTALVELHKLIIKNDWSFNYPAIAETEQANLYLPLSTWQDLGDSLLVTVLGGRYDGIIDTAQQVELFTHFTAKDTIYHKGIEYISTGRIINLENNRTIIKTKKTSIGLLPGDIVFVKAQVPLSWRKLGVRDLMLNNLYLLDNSRQHSFHRRYFYYYADSLAEKESFANMQTSVNEIADMLADDTLTNEQYGKKMTEGIFNGYNLIRAMKLSQPQQLQLFLNFVHKFPGKYISNDYKFSETYATWIINNTPLDPADIKPWLIDFLKTPALLQQQAANIATQIVEDHLQDQWLDEGMQHVNIENLKLAGITAALMKEVNIALQNNNEQGWADYLFANIEKRKNNPAYSDSLLNNALLAFTAAKNTEGIRWVNNTKELWKKEAVIEVGVQNGHIFSYVIAQSTNPRYFATGSDDNLIKIWDRNLGKEILTLNQHRDEVNALQYSPNGRYLASAGQDSFIYIYNAYNYGLLYSLKTAAPERTICFSPDNTMLVTAGKDSVIKFRDFKTGEIKKTFKLHKGTVYDICFNAQLSNRLYSAGADSMVYKWDTDTGEMLHWYRQKGKALSVKLSHDGLYMSVVSTDSLLTIWNTQTNKKLFTAKIHVINQSTTSFYTSESFSANSKYITWVYARDSFAVLRLNDLYQRVYCTFEKYIHLADLQFSNDGQSLYARFNLGGPLRIYNFVDWDIKTNPTISRHDIKMFANMPMILQFTKDDNNLVVSHAEISKIDLRNGSFESLYYGGMPEGTRQLLLNNEKLGVYFEMKNAAVNLYDYKNKNIVQQFALPAGEVISCIEISPDDKYFFMGSKKGFISAWDITTHQLLFARQLQATKKYALNKIIFNAPHNRLLLVLDSSNILMLDALTGICKDSILITNANDAVISEKYIYATDNNGWLHKFNATTLSYIKKKALNNTGDPAYQLLLSADEKIIVAQSSFTDIAAINTDTDTLLYSMYDHDYGGTMMALSHDGKMLATAGFDSKINFYHAATGKPMVSMYIPMERNVMIADKEGHYLASKNTLDAISFSFNKTAYSYDQFDLQLNRPDLVLSKLGRADSNLLKTFYAAYKKRLSKAGIDEKYFSNNMHLPLVTLQDKFAVQTVTTQKEFTITVECSDNLYALKSLQVLVNNNPVLGINGMDLSKLNTKETTQKITIPLSTDRNSIKVFCTNAAGVQSLKESFEITSKYKSTQEPKTYFIGIAVASYKDSNMNLQYSAKDVRDLARSFTQLYDGLVTDTLINIKATKENILALKKKLMLTNVNDRVILAITGHGLLSKSFDFYYATWDTDFNDPEKRAIKYEDLENLLTYIPARKKLMLIDACHSGALDKEELTAQKITLQKADSNEAVKGIVSRGVIKLNKAAAMGPNSSFQMMQQLFTDLSGNNGAVIISAAGGMEYALESAQWNNGVFTYCVRKGIEQKMADTDGGNFDGRVSVQELQQYVSRKVSELTNGKQQPTSRRENIDYEWWLRN